MDVHSTYWKRTKLAFMLGSTRHGVETLIDYHIDGEADSGCFPLETDLPR